MNSSEDKLLIFDCDGVLVDSEIVANRIEAEALTSIGYSLTIEECIKRFTGISTNGLREIIFKESGLDIPLDFLANQQDLISKAFEIELRPLMTEILQMIDEMKIMRCVASSSPLSRVIKSLELTQQISFFNRDSIFTSQLVLKGKPAPDLFLFAAKQMGFSSENCLVIEDSFSGIQAAISAGMQVIGFLGGSHTQYEWYQQKIKSYNIPIAYNTNELLLTLKECLNTERSLL